MRVVCEGTSTRGAALSLPLNSACTPAAPSWSGADCRRFCCRWSTSWATASLTTSARTCGHTHRGRSERVSALLPSPPYRCVQYSDLNAPRRAPAQTCSARPPSYPACRQSRGPSLQALWQGAGRCRLGQAALRYHRRRRRSRAVTHTTGAPSLARRSRHVAATCCSSGQTSPPTRALRGRHTAASARGRTPRCCWRLHASAREAAPATRCAVGRQARLCSCARRASVHAAAAPRPALPRRCGARPCCVCRACPPRALHEALRGCACWEAGQGAQGYGCGRGCARGCARVCCVAACSQRQALHAPASPELQPPPQLQQRGQTHRTSRGRRQG
eukprot:352421-Chlamydomonas_euryale.AAC.2